MSEEEYIVVDALYFIRNFAELVVDTNLSEDTLTQVLFSAYAKGWVKPASLQDGELPTEILTAENVCTVYFMATKKGLFAHTTGEE